MSIKGSVWKSRAVPPSQEAIKLQMLGKPPAEPQRSPVEQDAITLLLLRQGGLFMLSCVGVFRS